MSKINKLVLLLIILMITLSTSFIFLYNYIYINYSHDLIFTVKKDTDFSLINGKNEKISLKSYEYLGDIYDNRIIFYDGKNWGYLNEFYKKIILAKFDAVKDFNYGKAAIKINNKWGYIDIKGDVIVEPIYNWCGNFYNDFSLVSKDSIFYIINKYGEIIHELNYEMCLELSENVILGINSNTDSSTEIINYQNQKLFNIPSTVKEVIGYSNDILVFNYINEFGEIIYSAMDKNENLLFDGFDDLTLFNNKGISFYGEKINNSIKYGVLNHKNINTDLKFDSVSISDGKIFPVSINTNNSPKYGYINPRGDTVIPFDYDMAFSFKNGYAAVGKLNKSENMEYGIINEKGKEIIESRFQMIKVNRVRNEKIQYETTLYRFFAYTIFLAVFALASHFIIIKFKLQLYVKVKKGSILYLIVKYIYLISGLTFVFSTTFIVTFEPTRIISVLLVNLTCLLFVIYSSVKMNIVNK